MTIPSVRPAARPARATPLSQDERRAMIIEAVTPLLLEFGPAVTSRQIAEAAGVAEGTVYRAFGDKDALIRAVLDKCLDPEALHRALERIDPAAPLEDKVHVALALMQSRFREIFGLMAMFGHYHKRPSRESREALNRIFGQLLEPDLTRLNVPADRVAQIIRLLTFSASLPHLNDGAGYDAGELTDIVLYGIAGRKPEPRDHPEPRNHS